MKTKSKITAHILRSSAAALLVSCVAVAVSSAINLPNHPPKVPAAQNSTTSGVGGQESFSSVAASATRSNRTLTFADRVAYQRAIEEVYWQHRIWPKANPGPKPPLDKVMSQAQIEKKVEDYLRNSQALEDYWQRQITPDQLQAEMERIASHTKQPGVLRELFAVLGNDPFVVAECLARPVLTERLVTELYAHDQRFHGELKQRAEAELQTHPRVSQMKKTSGMYSEVELVRTDTSQAKDTGGSASPEDDGKANRQTRDTESGLKLNSREWDENVQKLAAMFRDGAPEKGVPIAQIKTGVLSPLQEDDGRYYAVAIVKKGKARLKLATVAWLKEPLRSWVAKAEAQVPRTMAAVSANYTLPVIASPSGGCIDDTWTPTSLTNAPAARAYHTAVWTGSEMIIWGGIDITSYLNTGGRYNPSTDSWTATSTTGAPTGRSSHTAVWTGSEVIIWGGINTTGYFNTGGRYNPGTDSWTATSTANAPARRFAHTAVWTGSQMIIWGGRFGFSGHLNTGGRYDPSTNSWTATSTIGAPDARGSHTAVWTSSEMIVWGGVSDVAFLNTGGRYDPSTDSWTATSTTDAPTGRDSHTAVWTGGEMIVWGGYNGSYFNTGGRYNPATDSWTATSITSAPAGRAVHTEVWTGTQMIVWGGVDGTGNDVNTGGRYNPSTDSWTATSSTDAPTARAGHTAVWTGTQMIVWGGYNSVGVVYLNTGGRYCAAATSGPITLSAAGRKVGGINTVRLTWSGATSASIDVYRDGALIVTTANDGVYTDSTGDTGRARYTYKVCEAGTMTCSNEVTVRFRQ
jgi:N-acetylneuraminic acid mutarotase